MPHLLHASGRFDSGPKALRDDLARWRAIAGIVTLTEVAAKGRKAELMHRGWTVTSGKGEGRGECAILSNRALWKRRARYVVPLTDGKGLGRLSAPIFATTAVLQRRSNGRNVIVSTCHMPAHVETLLRLGVRAAPASTWRQTAKSWALHVDAVRAAYPGAEVFIDGDFNVDARSDRMRRMVRDAFKVAGGDLRVARTSNGTHHARVIDFALCSLKPESATTRHAEASDHKAVAFVASWPRKGKS